MRGPGVGPGSLLRRAGSQSGAVTAWRPTQTPRAGFEPARLHIGTNRLSRPAPWPDLATWARSGPAPSRSATWATSGAGIEPARPPPRPIALAPRPLSARAPRRGMCGRDDLHVRRDCSTVGFPLASLGLPPLLLGHGRMDACGWTRTNERVSTRAASKAAAIAARRRTHDCARQDLNLRISRVSDGCVGRIIGPVRCQAALRARFVSARGGSVLRRNRVVVRRRFLGRPRHRPARIRTGDSASKARWDWLLPHGAMVAPPRFKRGPPRPGRGTLASCATGLFDQRRIQAGHAARDGVAQRPKSKTDGIPDPLQRMMTALPSSSVANRCWDSTRPDGFRNAVRIIATLPRGEALFAGFVSDCRIGDDERAREDLNPDLSRSKRPMLSWLHHMPERPPSRIERLSAGSHPAIQSGGRRGRGGRGGIWTRISILRRVGLCPLS